MSEVAEIGHNNPPSATLFEQSRDEIEELYAEAGHWLDGKGVNTQAEADGVTKLLDMLRDAVKTANANRTAENKPFDEGKKAVQARYAPLIADTKSAKGKAVIAIEACKEALRPYREKIDAEKKAAADDARKQAEAAEIAAQEAFANTGAGDLDEREEAERLASDAKKAATFANRAARNAKVGTGLRTNYRAELINPAEFARFVWQNHNRELMTFLQELAQRLANDKQRSIPGVKVHEERKAV